MTVTYKSGGMIPNQDPTANISSTTIIENLSTTLISETATPSEDSGNQQVELLTEIRDLLKILIMHQEIVTNQQIEHEDIEE